MDAKFAYRETAVRGATPVQLVILLYEQLIQDLRRAIVAMEKNQIERRTAELNHALAVIAHLQSVLNLERGGQIARNLEQFYSALRASLVEAQGRVSRSILQQQIVNLLALREAWIQVDLAVGTAK